MANPNKDDMNQNQHTNKAMGASAGGGTGAHQPDIESLDAPENLGGERPNQSNTRMPKSQTGERLDLQSNEEQPERRNR